MLDRFFDPCTLENQVRPRDCSPLPPFGGAAAFILFFWAGLLGSSPFFAVVPFFLPPPLGWVLLSPS